MEATSGADDALVMAEQAVLVPGNVIPDTPVIRGWDFNTGSTLDGIMGAMLTTGFQATSLGQAVNEVNRMINWRLSDDPIYTSTKEEHRDLELRKRTRCRIFLSFTSNLGSAGTREHIRWMIQHRMVDVVVATAGAVEEDLIKCMGNMHMGDFAMKGADLRAQGLNRTGNILVPNVNYCVFEDWIMPHLNQMLKEQNELGTNWTPSKMLHRFGERINNEDSMLYWAAKNNIPVFCPPLTDGSIGDMFFFHSYKSPGLRCDIIEDVRKINDLAIKATPRKTGMIILGGGVPKHHICNANLMRNGADFAVYVSTAQEFDGCDSGAKPDEAVSWGKIKLEAKPIKVYADATIILPLLLSQTFVKHWVPKTAEDDANTALLPL